MENIIYYRNMEDPIKIFVAGLKKVAKIKRVTQEALGNAIGRDQTTISGYYNGKTRPTEDAIKNICTFLNVEYQEILEAGRKISAQDGLAMTEQQPMSGDTKLERENVLLTELLAMKNDKIAGLEKKIAELEAAKLGEESWQSKFKKG